jgi:tetratricopeptide (TPR) repeat protein
MAGAEKEHWEAVRLAPNNAAFHSNLGLVLRDRNDLEGAEKECQEAVRLNPNIPSFHATLGTVLRERNDSEGAEKEYREAIRLNPKNAAFHHTLGNILRDRNDAAGAEPSYREALRLNPNRPWSHYGLGRVQLATRRLNEAEASFREVIRLDPKDADLLHRTARVFAAGPDGVRDGKRAVELATRSCELDEWKKPLFIDTLAAAYAEVGDFEKAVEYQTRAIAALDAEKGSGPGFADRLALYERKKPFRDPTLAPTEPAPPPRVKQ